MRQQNRAVILATIQEQGPISRVELASLLGLTAATITRITRDLIDDGLVKEEGEGSTGSAGRKRILLHFNHGARLVISIHADERQVTGIIANLAGEILNRRTALISPQVSTESLTELIEELLKEDPSFRQRLVLVGVCVDDSHQAASLADGLRERLGLSVIATDTFTAAVTGEANSGVGSEQNAFGLLYLGTESRSCIYLNGQSRVGRIGVAKGGAPLSDHLCDAGLVKRLVAACMSGMPSVFALNPHKVGVKRLFEGARRHDLAARKAVIEAVDDLTQAILWMSSALALTEIVLAGSWMQAADLLLPMVNERLSKYENPPHVTISKLGDDAALIGAVHLAINAADPTFKDTK
jgi:predicted NBD/HSP70 family sugar kinase